MGRSKASCWWSHSPHRRSNWECKSANDSTEPISTRITWQELKGEKVGCSTRAVLEGPGSRTDSEGSLSTSNSHHRESNESSTASWRKGLSIGSSTNEDETGACESVPQQKQGKPRLWKSFVQKQWQYFPSSSYKKDMVISEHVLITPDNGEASEIYQNEDAAGSLLRAATNGRNLGKQFFIRKLPLQPMTSIQVCSVSSIFFCEL